MVQLFIRYLWFTQIKGTVKTFLTFLYLLRVGDKIYTMKYIFKTLKAMTVIATDQESFGN